MAFCCALSAAHCSRRPSSHGAGNSGLVLRFVLSQTGWTETVLFNFNPSTTGGTALGEIIRDSYRSLSDVAHQGGPRYEGTVFEISVP